MLAVLLAGCGGSFAANSVTPVNSADVSLPMQYAHGPKLGPVYNLSMTMPAAWVGDFEVRSIGNKAYVNYVGDGNKNATIFTVEALSEDQYWQQVGSFPGSYATIINRGDTYFVYYLPIDSFYSSLPPAEFEAFAAEVPAIMQSVTVEEAS